MSNRVTLVVEAVDRFSGIFRSLKSSVTASTSAVSSELEKTKKRISELKEKQVKVDSVFALKRSMLDVRKSWQEAEGEIKKNSVALAQAKAVIASMKQEIESAKKRFVELKQNASATKQEISDAKNEVKKGGDSLKVAEKNASELTRRMEEAHVVALKAKQTYVEKHRKIDDIVRGLGQEKVSISQVSSAYREASLELERQKRLLKEQESTAKRIAAIEVNRMAAREEYDKSMSRSASLSVAGTVAINAGKSILSGTAKPFSLAMNLDKELSALRAVTVSFDEKLSQSQKRAVMESFKEQALSLSKFGYSAAEVVRGMFGLSTAGFNSTEIKSSIGSVIQLAKAGGVGVEAATDISASTLRAFKLSATKDMTSVADILASTANATNASIESLGLTLKYVAPNAKAAGVSLSETAVMAGLLSNVGIKGEQAGTTLRGGLLKLIAPSKKAAHVLKELGVIVGDKDHNMRKLPEILDQIRTKTTGMGNVKRAALLKEIFDTEALTGMQNLIEQTAPVWEESTKKWIKPFDQAYRQIVDFKGAAGLVASEMGNNSADAFQRFSLSLDTIKIRFADLMLPKLTLWLDSVFVRLEAISAWVRANPIFAKAIGGTTVAVGGLAVAFGAVATALGTVGTAIAMSRFGLKNLRLLFKGGGAASLGSIPSLFGRVGSLASRSLPKLLGPIGSAISLFPDMAKGLQSGSVVTALFGGVESSIPDQALKWGGVGATIGSFIAPGIGTAIGAAVGAGLGALGKYLSGIGSLSQAFDSLSRAVTSWFAETTPRVGRWLGEIAGSGVAYALNALRNIYRALTSGEWWMSVATSIWSFITQIAEKSTTIIKSFVSGILSGFRSFGDGFSRTFQETNLSLQMPAHAVAHAGVGSFSSARFAASLPVVQPLQANRSQQNNSFQTTITVNAAPGMSEDALAEKVRAQIDLHQRQQAARTRGRIFDDYGR